MISFSVIVDNLRIIGRTFLRKELRGFWDSVYPKLSAQTSMNRCRLSYFGISYLIGGKSVTSNAQPIIYISEPPPVYTDEPQRNLLSGTVRNMDSVRIDDYTPFIHADIPRQRVGHRKQIRSNHKNRNEKIRTNADKHIMNTSAYIHINRIIVILGTSLNLSLHITVSPISKTSQILRSVTVSPKSIFH